MAQHTPAAEAERGLYYRRPGRNGRASTQPASSWYEAMTAQAVADFVNKHLPIYETKTVGRGKNKRQVDLRTSNPNSTARELYHANRLAAGLVGLKLKRHGVSAKTGRPCVHSDVASFPADYPLVGRKKRPARSGGA